MFGENDSFLLHLSNLNEFTAKQVTMMLMLSGELQHGFGELNLYYFLKE